MTRFGRQNFVNINPPDRITEPVASSGASAATTLTSALLFAIIIGYHPHFSIAFVSALTPQGRHIAIDKIQTSNP